MIEGTLGMYVPEGRYLIMSDLYDSLEDECDGNKHILRTPQESPKRNSPEKNFQQESPKKYSFYLKLDSDEDRNDILLNKKLLNDRQRKHFLPKVPTNSEVRGARSAQNLTLNQKILNQQGLQLNVDGSITKSPRLNEELPFVKKEYRNLLFQKRKTFGESKKVSSFIIKKTTQVDPSLDLTKWRRKSTENFFTNYPNFLKEVKQTTPHYNMTDSMKEKYILLNKINSSKIDMEKNFRKSKSDTISSETWEISHKKGKQGIERKNSCHTHHSQNNSNGLESIPKPLKRSKSKIQGYVSNISLPTLRPRLNYSERYKMEKNFNLLKQFNKKVESDTNRSNFGDSVVEELPEIETIPGNGSVSAREDEELFYKKLIDKDKLCKRHAHHSARSEGPVYVGKLRSVLEEKKNIFNNRTVSSAMKIDLDVEVDNLVSSFKNSSHFCYDNTSAKATKVELALKGKTYGYLANARNIFRLKVQSKKKPNIIDKEENVKKASDLSRSPKKIKEVSRKPPCLNSKTTCSSVGIFPNVKRGSPQYLDRSPRPPKTKLNVTTCDVHKKLVLPEVDTRKSSYTKIRHV